MRTEERRNVGMTSPGNEGNESFDGNGGDHRDRCGEVSRISRSRGVGSVGIQVNRSIGQ
jgi:hypothetical protein